MENISTNNGTLEQSNPLTRFLLFLSNIYERIASLISQNNRNRLSILGAMLIVGIYFAHNMGIILLLNTYTITFIKVGGFFWDFLLAIGIFLLALPLLGETKQEGNRNVNKKLLIPLSIFMLLFGFSAFTSTAGRLKLFLIYFCLFLPILIVIKPSRGINKELNSLLLTVIIYGAIYYIASFFLVPYSNVRYVALSLNANALGQLSTCILTASLVKAHYEKNKLLYFFYHLISAISIVFTFVSKSRTSFLVVIVILTVYLVFLLSKGFTKNFIRLLVTLFVYIIVLFSLAQMFEHQPKIFEDVISPNNIYFNTIERLISQKYNIDPNKAQNINSTTSKVNQETQTKTTTVDNSLFSRFDLAENVGDDNLYYFKEHSNLYVKIDKLTTHRLSIWNAYIQHLELYGQPSQEIRIDRYRTAATAHQLFIQIAYDTGIVGGIVYLTFIAVSSGYVILVLIKKKDNLASLLYVLSTFNYIMTGLVASNCYSNVYLSSFLFYFSLIPLMINSTKDFREKETKINNGNK